MKLTIKKHLSLLIAILFTLQGTWAQAPQNRTTLTIIADGLAQLPGVTPKQYRLTIRSLVDTGEEGLITLINMMNPPGDKSNEKMEYAISGWTNYVANDAAKSAVAATTYGKALTMPLNKYTKQFIIRQLELIGNESNIDALAGFLQDEFLTAPAAQALVNMRNRQANEKLLFALADAKNEKVKINLINAIGQSGNVYAELDLLKLLNTNTSATFNNVLYGAISKVGTTAAIQPLKLAANKENYLNTRSNATAAYVHLLNRLATIYPVEVQTAANDLLTVAKNNQISHLSIASLELLMQLTTVNKHKLLTSALKDKNIAYLTNALRFYTDYADEKGTNIVIKGVKKNKQEAAKASMIYWLGDQKANNAAPTITKYLSSSHPDLQKAAIIAISQIGGERALKSLTSLLTSNNAATLATVHGALSNYNGNITNELTTNYDSMSDEGKVVALDLLGTRKMTSQYNLVYNQLTEANEQVQKKAALTLKDVASAENLPDLFNQIEQGDNKHLEGIQAAVNAVLSTLPEDKQLALISDRMSKSTKPYAFYVSLANTGASSALDLIMKGYAKGGKNATAAFNALLNIKRFDAVYPLLEIARNSKSTSELSKATDALASLIAKSNKTGIVKANYLQELMSFATTEKQKIALIKQLGNTDSFQALLFIEQLLDNSLLADAAAQAGQKIALNNPAFAGGVTTNILHKISKALTNPDASYQRQAIDKYLAENKDAAGYVPLFNGKDLTGWKGLVGNPLTRAKMTKKELDQAQIKADEEAALSWVVDNGLLLFKGKGNNLCTTKQYGDFEMMVDWKLFPGKAPDAGIYLRGTPQVQIWDTARVKVGAQVGSGGLYNNKENESKPLTVADQKLGEWNTFYIKMVGDRVTVYLNGELVTDNVMLENFWDRNQPIFSTEQIELQAHGSEVAYRNIYIREIPRPEPFQLSPEEAKEGFEVLFDGTNMYKWTGNTTDYVTEDGCIVIYPSKKYGGNLYTKEEFSDFEFRFKFQLTAGANNGLGIRAPLEGDAAYLGMELQILDNDAPIYERLKEYQYHGSVYGVIPAKRGHLKPLGEWNYQEVIAHGDHIKITLNGTVILDGNIREATKEKGTMDGLEHPGLFNKKGHIGFLGHGSVVKFKEIRIKRLK